MNLKGVGLLWEEVLPGWHEPDGMSQGPPVLEIQVWVGLSRLGWLGSFLSHGSRGSWGRNKVSRPDLGVRILKTVRPTDLDIKGEGRWEGRGKARDNVVVVFSRGKQMRRAEGREETSFI